MEFESLMWERAGFLTVPALCLPLFTGVRASC
jgi:hypothetical protein